MNNTYKELVLRIVNSIREKAQSVPVFKESGNGAIRICAYPLCKEADDWFGGFGHFPDDNSSEGQRTPVDIPDYEHTFAIAPGGSRVIKGTWDGVEQTVDCYAYSALKIAHCSRAQDLGLGLISGLDLQDPNLLEENGYASHKGAIAFEISVCHHPESLKDFCGIYVCVSGAKSDEDLMCAAAAIDIVKEFFLNEERHSNTHFIVYAPTV